MIGILITLSRLEELLFTRLIPVSSHLEGFAAFVWRYTSCFDGLSSFQLPDVDVSFTIRSSKAPNEEV